jgi:AraC-like DNA-binding protein
MDAIATRLHMSPSTLRRRLRQEGVTHRWLLQEVRRDFAFVSVQRQDISIDEVAYLVGYDDPTAFHKAFKRWTGNIPTEHRSRPRRWMGLARHPHQAARRIAMRTLGGASLAIRALSLNLVVVDCPWSISVGRFCMGSCLARWAPR